MIIHSGAKKFKCQYCSHTSNKKGNLKTHVLTVHNLPFDDSSLSSSLVLDDTDLKDNSDDQDKWLRPPGSSSHPLTAIANNNIQSAESRVAGHDAIWIPPSNKPSQEFLQDEHSLHVRHATTDVTHQPLRNSNKPEDLSYNSPTHVLQQIQQQQEGFPLALLANTQTKDNQGSTTSLDETQ